MENKLKKILSSKLTISSGEYKKYIIHLTSTQIHSFYFKCHNPQFFRGGEKINLNYAKTNRKKPFVVFLNKSQIKDVNKAKRNQTKYTLLLTYKQLKKTCPFIIKINDKIEEIKKLIKQPKVNKKEDLIKKPKPKKKVNKKEDLIKQTKKKVNKKEDLIKKPKPKKKVDKKEDLIKHPKVNKKKVEKKDYGSLYKSLKKFQSRKKKPNEKKSIFDDIYLTKPLII